MKYDATNTTLIEAIVSLAKQVQCDWIDTNNVTRLEECEFYMDAVKEGLEIIRTLVDMALKDYPAHKAKKGGER